MNYLFVQAANRRKQAGALARLTGSPPVDTDTPLAERLTRLLDERETAMQAWETDALAFVEHKLERWDEARAAQKAAEQPPPSGSCSLRTSSGCTRGRRFFKGGCLSSGIWPRSLRASSICASASGPRVPRSIRWGVG
jgi:hypothetical protein